MLRKHFSRMLRLKHFQHKYLLLLLKVFRNLDCFRIEFYRMGIRNPNGVVSLPTGKTAQYFINYTHLILDNWDNKQETSYSKNII